MSDRHPFVDASDTSNLSPYQVDTNIIDDDRNWCNADRELGPGPSITGRPASVISRDPSIWLQDNSKGEQSFARDVKISGWTHVGDKLGGAYIVYDCDIGTKEGTVIRIHKRYTDFAQLDSVIRRAFPQLHQQRIPKLPPKAPLARYRPAFLDHRRRGLQFWLSAVLMHPQMGSSPAVRQWVTN